MEVQFRESSCRFLRSGVYAPLEQEQTQELRLPDSMPDVGRVLGIWGQCLIRSKEWRSGSIGANGGVTVWVLYAPEDGTEPRRLETWVPFGLRWEQPQTREEGTVRVDCRLAGLDARVVSPRKLMLRAQISALGEALAPEEGKLYTPVDLPQDVQLLEKTCAVTLAREAGEKTFEIDEELTLPQELSGGEQLVYLRFLPQVRETRVMGDKLVFRGELLGQGALRCADGQLRPWEPELGFAQYVPLEEEFSPQAQAETWVTLTGLEPELLGEGRARLRLGLVGQYLVYDEAQLKTVEDAYSPLRTVEQQRQGTLFSAYGPAREQRITAARPGDREPGELTFLLAQGRLCREGENWMGALRGSFCLLSDDPQLPKWTVCPWEGTAMVEAQQQEAPRFFCCSGARPRAEAGELRCEVQLWSRSRQELSIASVCALELGEPIPKDPRRPSFLVKRAGKEGLWELAKSAGSTREAIVRLNGLDGEPPEDKMLLIPVM